MKCLEPTIKTFLKTALEPVGETMYIWGGGWNEAGTGAGCDALCARKNPEWKKFFETRTPEYNFRDYMFRRGCGLDCSGYVGWVMYSFFMRTRGKARQGGYVFKAGEQAQKFAQMELGTYTPADKVTDYKAGDIMSSPEHVYIVIGECPDGSVVLLHSSPPGVQICGTYSKSGIRFSHAAYLARTYMSERFGEWYNKFGCRIKDTSYLTEYAQFRWNRRVISDPEGLTENQASAVLATLETKTSR